MTDPSEAHDSIVLDGRRFVELISAEQIADAVVRIAGEIDRDYGGKPILLLCVLKGALVFCADLMRALESAVAVEIVGLSSYGDATVSSGTPTFTARPGTPVADRNVIVVEDIVDSGTTLRLLRRYLHDEGAASVRVATMLRKPGAEAEVIDYVGFDVDDRFVIGYGMDLAEEMRELPGIWVADCEKNQRA